MRWFFVSLLTLGNVSVIIYVLIILYARRQVSLIGGGPSPSEYASPYIWILTRATATGAIVLALTSLYWFVSLHLGFRLLPLNHKQQLVIKVSLVAIPLIFSILFCVGVAIYCLSGGHCFPLGMYFWE